MTGQPVARVDGRLKVTGRARYAADNPAPNMVYAALVTSTVARGSVERIEPASAVRHPDVLRVLTDFGGVKLPYDIRQVSCFGQAVAIVVATTSRGGHRTAHRWSRCGTEPPRRRPTSDAPQAQRSRAAEHGLLRGDADAALRTAAVVTDIRYSIERNNHNPMEIPATVASWDGDQLTVWDKVQSIRSARSRRMRTRSACRSATCG